MNRTVLNPRSREKNGSTLVILAVVLVNIGVLAGFGVPRFLNSVERSRRRTPSPTSRPSARPRNVIWLARARMPRISPRSTSSGPPRTVSAWGLRGGRLGQAGRLVDPDSDPLRTIGRFGTYTVAFTEQGYDNTNSTIDSLPAINPER